MQQKILVADRGKEVVAAEDARRDAGGERRILEVRPVDQVVHRREAIEIHRARHLVQIIRSQLELLQQERGVVGRAVVRRLEAHFIAVAALRKLALDRTPKIVDFFLVDEQVRVARHAKLPAALDLHAFEELAHVALHDRRQVDERQLARIAFLSRHVDDARQRARHLHDREVRVAAEGIGAGELDDEVQALVLDLRERPCRVEREGRQHRFHFELEVALERRRLRPRRALWLQQVDARLGQCRRQLVVEDAVLLRDQCPRARVDRDELLADRHAVGADGDGAALLALLERGDADLEELIEVRGTDREEAQPLEERHRPVLGKIKNALVELEERQFPIDVEVRGLEIHIVHVPHRCLKTR